MGVTAWSLKGWAAVAALAGALTFTARSQSTAPLPDDQVKTLHVYTDLVQVPTLVLGQDRKPVPAIAGNRFMISLDGGPRFRVNHVRLEGEDPISLEVLLDLTQPFSDEIAKFDFAMAALAPEYVHPRDRLAIFSMDCNLLRSTVIGPPQPATLKKAVDEVLQPWEDRRRTHEKSCAVRWHLWDALALMTHRLATEPGRRVILVVSDGLDRGSKNNWTDLRTFAQENGVALFGLTLETAFSTTHYSVPTPPNYFTALCEPTGGIVMMGDRTSLSRQLVEFVQLLRARYIVEFPRPSSQTGGFHNMDITIERSSAFIRPAGISVPVDDPTVLSDPTTVPSDPTSAPQLGKKKP